MAKKHVLPDRLRPGLKLVFCGTAAGRQSALQQAYYAHGQNRFWRTLYEVGLTPQLFLPQDYEKLWELGIGLTDIANEAPTCPPCHDKLTKHGYRLERRNGTTYTYAPDGTLTHQRNNRWQE